jgi:hypothetical protein
MRNLFVIAALAAVFSSAALAAGRDQFEGKWTVTVMPDDGSKPYQETLIFKTGKFTWETGKAHGFGEVAYDADVRGGQSATFTATGKSAKEGTIKWTGNMAATSIQGTISWTKADGSTDTFTFNGMRAEK